MNFKTKKKYLKIIHTHNQIDVSLRENAPFISKNRIFELTANKIFDTDHIILSRPTFYRAIKYERYLITEEPYLR
jgi:hypothetical protein